MKTSVEVDQLAAALVAFQGELPVIPKNRKAEVYSERTKKTYFYNYADLSDVVVAVQPLLLKHGLAVSQPPAKKKKKGNVLTTRVYHKSGQWQEEDMDLLVPGTTPQAQGSGITYSRRYAYCAALGIVSDEDDDGTLAQQAYGEGSGRSRKRPPASSRSSTPGTAQRRSQPATDPVTDGLDAMSTRDRNKLIAHLARELKITEPEAQTKKVNEVLGLGEGTLEWVAGLAKLTSAQGATLFAEFDLPLG